MKTYQDFCHSVTKKLFEIIDQNGSLLSWQKNWDTQSSLQLPIGSNGLYRGANLFVLLNAQLDIGFNSNQWLTFNQVKKLGGCVKKGAKSQGVYFWKIREVQQENRGEKEVKKVPIFKSYNVFNLEQTSLDKTVLPSPDFNIKSIDELVGTLGATVTHFGNRAYYNHLSDIIYLPNPDRFNSRENYYATLLHELVHWTAGREKRLPRECFKEYQNNIKARAEEELVAEIGSALLTIHFGVRGELEGHASYVQSWKKLLGEKQIMSATHKAARAFEWIIGQHTIDEPG